MAACHAGAATSDEISSVATPEALRDLWDRNLREMAPFVPHPLDPSMVTRIGELAGRYLGGRTALLHERIARGRIVDGHGDLLADDIFCLDDGPRILDGLEFDERLRWGDVLYDVGFLAMDLERLGRLDLAFAFLDWYWEYSAETHPPSLEHHYIAYRALVRAKISCLRGGADGEAEARAYLAQCQRHLLDARVQLVVIGGLPGTGKTTLAAALGDELGWSVLRSDEMRKELAGLDPLEHVPAAYGEGLYEPDVTKSTYYALFFRAGQLLARGESVVVDASFSKTTWRDMAVALAADADCRSHRAPVPVVSRRRRRPTGNTSGRRTRRLRRNRRRRGPHGRGVRAMAQRSDRRHPSPRRGHPARRARPHRRPSPAAHRPGGHVGVSDDSRSSTPSARR